MPYIYLWTISIKLFMLEIGIGVGMIKKLLLARIQHLDHFYYEQGNCQNKQMMHIKLPFLITF